MSCKSSAFYSLIIYLFLLPVRLVSLYIYLAIYMYFILVEFDVCYDENVNVLIIKLIFSPSPFPETA